MDASQYLEIFINEAKEHTEALREEIAALAAQPGRRKIFHDIFRTVHSLQGMAQTMGFFRMRRLAGSIEELCGAFQSGKGTVTGRIIDILSECLDAFEKYLENIKRTSQEGIEENEALRKVLSEAAAGSEEIFKALPQILRAEKQEIPFNNAGQEKKKKEKRVSSVPPTARMVRVDARELDDLMNQVGEMIMIKNRLMSLYGKDQKLYGGIEELEAVTANLHESVMQLRLVPMESVVNKFPRLIRDLARKQNKRMELYISGADTRVDRAVADQLSRPLKHLLCNAAKWGIESREVRWQRGKHEKGAIYLNIYQEDGNAVIHIRDDGGGMEQESFLQEESAETPGHGLASVRASVEALGGDLEMISVPERGTEFTIRIPLTLAIIQAVVAGVRQERYAIALGSILSIEDVLPEEVSNTCSKRKIHIRDMEIPLLYMDEIFEVPLVNGKEVFEEHLMPCAKEKNKTLKVIVVKKGSKYAGLVADSLIGQQEIVIKSLGRFIRTDKMISGAAVLGDGKIALIVDVNALLLGGG